MTATLPLHRGRQDREHEVVAFVLLDEIDDEWASVYYWLLDSQGYAARRRKRPHNGSVLLHREILGLTRHDARVSDHINRNKLDCRRANLRIVTRAQNNQNRDSYSNGGSQLRGVSWDKDRALWCANVTIAGIGYRLGRFVSEEEAGRVASEFRAENMPFSFEAGYE